MQPKTAAPREDLTATQVEELLTAPALSVRAGLELWDADGTYVEDISDDLQGGEVARDNYAAVHGSCRLQLQRDLSWGRDRVLPYMVLSDGTVEARFNLGMYVLTTPQEKRGEEPRTREVQGYDLLHLLQDGPGDTYIAEADGTTTYLEAVQAVVTASGVNATLRLDGTAQDTVIPDDRVWVLTEQGGASWLRIINDLLAEIGYLGLWCNHRGELRSAPYQQPSVRPVEWTFDTGNSGTDIMGQERVMNADVWAAPNHWTFVRRNMTAQPVDGAGIYLPAVNATTAEDTALGRIRRKVVFLDAADQAALVAQGDRIVAEDTAVTRTFEVQVDPLPLAGHFDVVRLVDGGRNDKCLVSSWTLPLDGGRGTWHLEAVGG